jgi:hypothetical protein
MQTTAKYPWAKWRQEGDEARENSVPFFFFLDISIFYNFTTQPADTRLSFIGAASNRDMHGKNTDRLYSEILVVPSQSLEDFFFFKKNEINKYICIND